MPKFSGPKKTFNWLDDLDSIIAESEDKVSEAPVSRWFLSYYIIRDIKIKVSVAKIWLNKIVNKEHIEFFQAFHRLSKDERAKILETMSDEQKENFKELQAEYER